MQEHFARYHVVFLELKVDNIDEYLQTEDFEKRLHSFCNEDLDKLEFDLMEAYKNSWTRKIVALKEEFQDYITIDEDCLSISDTTSLKEINKHFGEPYELTPAVLFHDLLKFLILSMQYNKDAKSIMVLIDDFDSFMSSLLHKIYGFRSNNLNFLNDFFGMTSQFYSGIFSILNDRKIEGNIKCCIIMGTQDILVN